MSQATLYANFRIRTLVPRALVKYLKLDINVVEPEKAPEQFANHFPLKKLPAFVDNKGWKLTEVMAILNYLVNASTDEKIKKQLLGEDLKTQCQVIRWQSLANSDLCGEIVKAFQPLRGDVPYNKKNVDTALAQIEKIANIYESRLKNYTYLASEHVTLGDLLSAAIFTRGFNYLFGKTWRNEHPAIVRWYTTMINTDILKEEFVDFKFIDEPLAPPKKEKKETKPKKAEQQPKKKEAAPANEEAPAQTEKKPKHPLEALGKATFVLDNWKRKYSNEETREVALPWFWDNYNPEEYSIWKVDYKYNDELTLTFMSNNLVGGFFNRLSASTKYVFGCMVIYGENNNNGITGAIMVRGQDYAPAFDVAPDWESYSYAKLDPTKDEDKEFINNMWAWDKPVVVNGENREIADGKVLK